MVRYIIGLWIQAFGLDFITSDHIKTTQLVMGSLLNQRRDDFRIMTVEVEIVNFIGNNLVILKVVAQGECTLLNCQ